MRSIHALAVVFALLAPGAGALPLPPIELPVQIEVIQDKAVQGEEEIGEGNYVVTGTISIGAGGLLRIRGADLEFAHQSPGIHIAPGGMLDVEDARLTTSAGEVGARGQFRITAEPGAILRMHNSDVKGGQGVVIRSNDADFSDNNISHNEVGVLLDNVDITLARNEFFDNIVAVNATGGMPKILNNNFTGGVFCVRDWRSDPDISYNNFTACKFGIWHEESNSTMTWNQMMDRNDPDSIAFALIKAGSPRIANNEIALWGTGILIVESGGEIEDNWIHDNVLDAIRVESQNGSIEITDNTIERNDRYGAWLQESEDVPVRGNVFSTSGLDGLKIGNASGLIVEGNDFSANGGHGVSLDAADGAIIESNDFIANGATGVMVASGSEATYVANNTLLGPHMRGFEAHGDRGAFVANVVAGAIHTGALVTGDDVRIEGGSITAGRVGLEVAFASGLRAGNFSVTDNSESGIVLVGATAARFERVASSRNEDGWVFADTTGVVLTHAKALDNRDDGLRNEQGAPPVSTYGHYEGNGNFGVHNLAASIMDATNSYWGSSTGPTSPLNPTGTGDAVSAGVLFVPFLTSPPA